MKQNQNKLKLISIVILTFIVIPVLLAGVESDYKDPLNERDTDGLFNSSVYYEDTDGAAQDVYVSGDYAYIADSTQGLAVIDISDPTNPGTSINEDTSGGAYEVHVSGDFAYIADDTSGLAVIDISDPTNPGTPVYEDTDNAYGLFVSGDYAYIADFFLGLAVIDISDPTNPGTPIYEDTTGHAWGVYVSGNYAYVADGNSGLAVIDISDPTNPSTPYYEDTTGYAYAVFVSGDYAYVADGDSGLAIIDISNPTNPSTPIYEDTSGSTRDIHVCGNYAYLVDYLSGLVVIDISDPTNPSTPEYRDIPSSVFGIYVDGNYAFLGCASNGLAIVDISEPIVPTSPIYEDTNGQALDIHVSGDYAYIADRMEGLAVIDISDPTNPGIPVYEKTTGDAAGVYVDGNYAYVATALSGLAVIDISDPTNPGSPIYENTNGYSGDVYVSGDYAYIAEGSYGLAIVDISDPTNPGTPVYENTDGFAIAVHVSGNYAYVADHVTGLAIIDISDPTDPGTPVYEDTQEAWDVCVSGNYAYVADSTSGLAVIDISDPTNPGTPNTISTGNTALDVCVRGNYAYVADGYSGLRVLDISDPTNPGFASTRDTSGYSSGIDVSGDYAFIADEVYGLSVIQVRMRKDIFDPIITIAPSDFTLETIYGTIPISWTATDANPNTYTIELQGSGIVDGPTAWSSGVVINYIIPSGLAVGEYLYTVNFTDDNDNFITDTINITIQDTIHPVITDQPSDFTIDLGYTGETISWTATDPFPNTYTIDLQGSGIVEGPTAWSSGSPITYNIPEGLSAGEYFYTVNFSDDYNNFDTDTVKMTIQDPDNPVIISAPSDFNTDYGYTGETISWTATDPNPHTYTIELQGSGIVEGPTAWSSGVAVIYNVPDGFGIGDVFYTINFTDDYGNFITDIVKMTINEIDAPVKSVIPSDFTLESGYSGETISWTATDDNPNTYTVALQGSGIVEGPTTWSSGVAVIYNIPDDLAVGEYFYTINFTDDYGRYITDTVKLTVQDTTNPVITSLSSDFTIESGYTGETISWTATDVNPNTYTIDLLFSGIVEGPTAWSSGVAIIYNIPDGLAVGDYTYRVNFTDESGNYVTDAITVTVRAPSTTPEIPFGNFYLIFLAVGVIIVVIVHKRRN